MKLGAKGLGLTGKAFVVYEISKQVCKKKQAVNERPNRSCEVNMKRAFPTAPSPTTTPTHRVVHCVSNKTRPDMLQS